MSDDLVSVNRFLESWIAFQMLRNLGCFAGKSIWDLIGMDANIGSWPGGYLCMYTVYIFLICFLLIITFWFIHIVSSSSNTGKRQFYE
jgi:hypothetical protein